MNEMAKRIRNFLQGKEGGGTVVEAYSMLTYAHDEIGRLEKELAGEDTDVLVGRPRRKTVTVVVDGVFECPFYGEDDGRGKEWCQHPQHPAGSVCMGPAADTCPGRTIPVMIKPKEE